MEDWEIEKLQSEIEGEAHAIKTMKAQNDRFVDTNKARTRNRRSMSKKKKRIEKLLDALEERYGVVVEQESIDSGIFPWHGNGSGNIFFNLFKFIAFHFFLFFRCFYCGRLRSYRHLESWRKIR